MKVGLVFKKKKKAPIQNSISATINIYIYIYMKRERERERESQLGLLAAKHSVSLRGLGDFLQTLPRENKCHKEEIQHSLEMNFFSGSEIFCL